MMWYEEILNQLIVKIRFYEQQQALKFLEHILTDFKDVMYPDEEIPFDLFLGVIDKMYDFYENHNSNSIKLCDFAQSFLGLLIIYSKWSEDNVAVWNDNFMEISNEQITKESLLVDLDLERYDDKFIKKYLSKVKICAQHINKIERDVLIILNYTLTVDLSHLLSIFTQLPDKYILNKPFLENIDLIGRSIEFDNFMEEINKLRVPQFIPIGHCKFKVADHKIAYTTKLEWTREEVILLNLIRSLVKKLEYLQLLLQDDLKYHLSYYAGVELEEKLLKTTIIYASDRNNKGYKRLKIECIDATELACSVINSCAEAYLINEWNEFAVNIRLALINVGNKYINNVNSFKAFSSNLFFKENIKIINDNGETPQFSPFFV